MKSRKGSTGKLDRRSFLQASAAAVLAPAMAGNLGAAPVAEAAGSLDFASAGEAAAAVRSGSVSSVELTKRVLERIERYNGDINAIVTLIPEDALKRAAEADKAQARGEETGPFHGVPITIKDTFEVAGVRTTAGAPELSKYVPKRSAVIVERIRAAGAVVVGKTNVPYMAGDLQSYNEIFGQTNNPWNLERTSGGSTGGGAAALAAGLTYLSLGSDIGGSIRTPANFCGVFGHKPTIDLVPEIGHIPPPPGLPSVSTNLAVAGPLARSVSDLTAALKVIGGPAAEYAVGYRWEMPPPRQASLKDYRVGYVLDDPACPVVPETKAVLEKTLKALEGAGAKLVGGWPAGINATRQFDGYMNMLFMVIDFSLPPAGRDRLRELAEGGDEFSASRVKTMDSPVGAAMMARVMQQGTRDTWQRYFQEVDVFLSPTTFMPAIPHDHSEQATRRLQTTLGERHYLDLLWWIASGTYSGCPVTDMPAGLTAEGLPVGLQIMGPFLEDATPLDFAAKLSQITGGYQPPPGFGV